MLHISSSVVFIKKKFVWDLLGDTSTAGSVTTGAMGARAPSGTFWGRHFDILVYTNIVNSQYVIAGKSVAINSIF